jgi:hypothetical protein
MATGYRVMNHDQEFAPQVGDLVDSQASLDDRSPVSAGMPARSPRRSVFREVPWQWSDVLLGFAPFLLLSAVTFLIGPRSSLAAASRQLLIPMTAYVASNTSYGFDAQTENARATVQPKTARHGVTRKAPASARGSTPPKRELSDMTGSAQQTSPNTGTSRAASLPSTISESVRSVAKSCRSLPLERSWQIAPAAAAGAARMTSVSWVTTIARKNPRPTPDIAWIVKEVRPEAPDTQTLDRPARSIPTKRARPAYTCQRRLVVTYSFAKTGPKPQRAVMRVVVPLVLSVRVRHWISTAHCRAWRGRPSGRSV